MDYAQRQRDLAQRTVRRRARCRELISDRKKYETDRVLNDMRFEVINQHLLELYRKVEAPTALRQILNWFHAF